MGQINLYQYPISPFTEKVRRVLTFKKLKWNPIDCHFEDKTNLLEITKGAWTRVPVLEWDGEVVYNSVDIIKWLERKVPTPAVIPPAMYGLCEIIDNWADNTLFMPILFLTIPDLLDGIPDEKLKANREKLIGMSTAKMRENAATHREALAVYCRMLDEQMAGKDFVLGGGFTLADASLYHPFYFLSLIPNNFGLTDGYKNLRRWYERVGDIA